MKRLHKPEPTQVELQGDSPVKFYWRGSLRVVLEQRDAWIYQGRWHAQADLSDEKRTYYDLLTDQGEFEIYHCVTAGGETWFVSGWRD